MKNVSDFNLDDEQLKLEMRAMAELLLDIYEYRARAETRSVLDHEKAVLDENQRGRTMKERSRFKRK